MIRFELLQQILNVDPTPRVLTVREVEAALRKVCFNESSNSVEEKIGMIYGRAFLVNEKNYDAGKQMLLR